MNWRGYFSEITPAFIRNYFSQKSSRDKSVIKNVGLGFIAKGLSIIIGFLQVPVTLSILDKTEYGVWITIFSVTSWLSFFDIGMGNGFRNKLTEALAENNPAKAKKIVSTTYITLALIFSGIILLFIPVSFLVNWQSVFQSPAGLSSQLYWAVLLCVIVLALNFVFGLIHTLLAAHHQTGKSGLLFLLSQLAILIFLYVYSFFKTGNAFIVVASVLVIIPLLLNVILNIVFFSGRFKSIAPSVASYEKKFLKELMSLGLMFFIIQIAAVVMYATDNIIITQLYGPEHVVTYSLVYRYYSILYIIFGIISTPLWTMYVDAYKKNDMAWIQGSVNNLVKLLYFFMAVIAMMLLASGLFFRLWIGPSFNPSLQINLLVAVYVLLLVWGNIWVLPLNAAGKIRVQMIVSILQALLNVPVIFLINYYNHNFSSVVMGNILCVLLGSGYMYFYYRRNFHYQKLQVN